MINRRRTATLAGVLALPIALTIPHAARAANPLPGTYHRDHLGDGIELIRDAVVAMSLLYDLVAWSVNLTSYITAFIGCTITCFL
jgi:hypothetical protein